MIVEAHINNVMTALSTRQDVAEALRKAYRTADPADAARAGAMLVTVPYISKLFKLMTPAEAVQMSRLVRSRLEQPNTSQPMRKYDA